MDNSISTTEYDDIYNHSRYVAEFSKKNNLMIITSANYEKAKSLVESIIFPENVKVIPLKEYPGIDIDMLGDYAERSVAICLGDEYRGGFKMPLKDIKCVNDIEEEGKTLYPIKFKVFKLGAHNRNM